MIPARVRATARLDKLDGVGDDGGEESRMRTRWMIAAVALVLETGLVILFAWLLGPRSLEQWVNVAFLAAPIVATAIFVVWWKLGSAEREQRRFWGAAQVRDEARYAAERSWVASEQWPLTHYQVYLTDWEFTEDLARMKALGYDVEWQEHTEDGIAVTYSLTPAYKKGTTRVHA